MVTFAATLSGTFNKLATGLRHLLALPDASPIDFPFSGRDIAQLHRVTSSPGQASPGQASLDDQTWTDLLLGPYLDSLSAGVSIAGRQELYRRLRAGLDDAECEALRTRLRLLQAEPERAERTTRALLPLRHADTEIAALLAEGEPLSPPAWLRWNWLLPLALLASIAGVILTPLSWLATAAVLYVLIALQMRYHERVEAWKRSLNTVQGLLRASALLAEDGQGPAAAARIAPLSRRLARSFVARLSQDAAAYGDWFMLTNVKHYYRSHAVVHGARDFLLDCYRHAAGLEADAVLARQLAAAPHWCWTERSANGVIALEAGVHPLLRAPSALSIALTGGGAFISGPNGSGKSTFLRMLGLNLVVARAFGFCYAHRASLPALPVYASMQNEDSLLDGQSLYIAELTRARALLAAGEGPHPGICLIDEIFRGTNHLESVAASAAVLDTLAARAPVIVSSHNLVLASLLEHRLTPLRIERDGEGTLALVPGVLARTNGVALLGAHGFGPVVEEKAQRVAAWLTHYLGQPEAGAQVLRPAAEHALEAFQACREG